MGDEGIFLIGPDQTLSVLQPQPYATESLLQQALERFPQVLAGGTTVDGAGQGLLLLRREMGVPTSEGAAAAYAIDHLFVDGAGVPVLVEVKRSSDTRIRREVVGQMLDYAANGVRYWPVSLLREAANEEAKRHEKTGEEWLHEAFPDADPEAFWAQVGDNLAAGRIRMVFVADRLPNELVRIIEFLNEQMQPAEVLGVEVPQFVGGGVQVLVPRMVGRTATAIANKQSAGGVPWTEESFLEQVSAHFDKRVGEIYRRLFQHCRDYGTHLNLGKGQSPGASAWYSVDGVPIPTWYTSAGTASKTPKPTFAFYFQGLRDRLGPAQFDQFIDRLRAVGAYQPTLQAAIDVQFNQKFPSVPLDQLVQTPSEVEALFDALDFLLSA